MLSLSKKTDYAILMLVAMAEYGDEYISLKTLARERNLPYRFVAQIARELKQEKIITSREGVAGGYRLAKGPGKISVKDVVSILEGGVALTECTACKQASFCPAQRGISKVQKLVLDTLSRKTIKDLMG